MIYLRKVWPWRRWPLTVVGGEVLWDADSSGWSSFAPKGEPHPESPAGLSGLDSRFRAKPRALPWAFVHPAFQALRGRRSIRPGVAGVRPCEKPSRKTRGGNGDRFLTGLASHSEPQGGSFHSPGLARSAYPGSPRPAIRPTPTGLVHLSLRDRSYRSP